MDLKEIRNRLFEDCPEWESKARVARSDYPTDMPLIWGMGILVWALVPCRQELTANCIPVTVSKSNSV